MTGKTKILLVEDDRTMANVVKKYFDMRGYEVVHCDNGKTALETFERHRFDICVIDVVIPFKDGFQLAQEIREQDEIVPLLFISSNTLPKHRIKAFRIGADDYVTKPINVEELQLRVEAIMKRQKQAPMHDELKDSENSLLSIGKYTLDFPYQRLSFKEGEARKLTSRETELLRFLYLHRNDTIKREFILQEVWGDDDYYKGRSLDVFISRLRKYLKDDPDIEILNVHGVGFKFLIQPGHGASA